MEIELLTSMAAFQLQAAFFHPTAAGSAEAFKKYLETQNKILMLQLERLTSDSAEAANTENKNG